MFVDYFKLAITSLTKRKLRSWLTLLGICVGIATVVSLIGLGEGLREAINNQFNLIDSDIITIQAKGLGGPPGTGVANPLTDKTVDALERVQGVKEVVGRVIITTPVEFRDEVDITYIGSIPDEEPEILYDMLRIDLDAGRLLKAGEQNRVFVGANYAGDEFEKPVELGNKVSFEGEEFEVVGILTAKGSFIVDGSIYMNHDQARRIYDRDDELDLILAQVVDEKELDLVVERVERALRNERNVDKGQEDFTVSTSASSASSINSILIGVNIFIGALAMISILVGGIGIANTMFTSVLERTNQIGIMKAIGAKNKDVFFIFLVESGLLGATGGIVGILIGSGFAFAGASVANSIFGTELFSVNISIGLIAATFIGSFLLGAAAGVIPAIRASSLQPVAALSYGK